MADTTNFTIEIPTEGGNRNSWGGILNVALQKLDELVALALPIGTIQMYTKANGNAPTATTNGGTWLVCNGDAVSRTTYSVLYGIIGTTYGVGDGSSTFNLPDLRARVPVGFNLVSGLSEGRTTKAITAGGGGAETHTLSDAQIPKHQHPITDNGHIHPIDPSTTHYHVGDQTGGKTSTASAVISDPEHSHGLGKGGTYSVSLSDGTGAKYSYNSTEWVYHYSGAERATANKATGVTDSGHDHSLTTDAKATGITTTQTNPSGRITTTNEQTTGDGSHNNMQPYLVLNYIILAKHPTF